METKTKSDGTLLKTLKALANLRNKTDASEFLKNDPEFLGPLDGNLPSFLRELAKNDNTVLPRPLNPEKSDPGRPLLEGLLRLDADKFGSPEAVVVIISDAIQRVWMRQKEATDILMAFLFVPQPEFAIRTAVGMLELRRNPDSNLGALYSVLAPPSELQLQPDWTRKEHFVYTPKTDFQRALMALWGKSELAKQCQNPECPAPYFIAGRALQRYCSDECATPFRLAAKMRYWNTKGKKVRAERRKQKTRKRGKRA